MFPLLSFKNVSYHYKDGQKMVHILKDACVDFNKGNFYAILGPSGSGKTSSLALAGGLDIPNEGTIYYDGKNIQEIGLTTYRKLHSAFVFQSYNLIPYLTALQNVIIGMDIAKTTVSNKKDTALEMLHKVGLSKSEAERNVLKLSGGQQQRVAIARAMACEGDLILADEPAGNLDQATADGIIQMFKEFVDKEKKCIIVVTHSQFIADSADVVLRLENGRFLLQGEG